MWLASITGGTSGNFSFNITVDGGPEHGLSGPALCGLETRMDLVQGVWNNKPRSREEQATAGCKFLSHGVEWPQVMWHLPKCIGPARSNDLRDTQDQPKSHNSSTLCEERTSTTMTSYSSTFMSFEDSLLSGTCQKC